ncbi:MAG: ferritin [Alphaproteobacteria bacterium]
MRLDKTVLKMLNEQMNMEFQASSIYLQMGAWAEARDLTGCAKFLYEHAEEEKQHGRKIFDYILERGGEPSIGNIKSPRTKYKDIKELFDQVYEEEKSVTDSIHKIAHSAWGKKDLATFSFLQWFIDEQREEEALATEIVGKIAVIGTAGQGLFMIDEFVGSRTGQE